MKGQKMFIEIPSMNDRIAARYINLNLCTDIILVTNEDGSNSYRFMFGANHKVECRTSDTVEIEYIDASIERLKVH